MPNNLWLIKNNSDLDCDCCIGAVVVADSEFEARNTYPEPTRISWDIRVNKYYAGTVKFDSTLHKIEQTDTYWFVRNPVLSGQHDKPENHFWHQSKYPTSCGWHIDRLEVTCIGTTDLPVGTIVLSSNVGS